MLMRMHNLTCELIMLPRPPKSNTCLRPLIEEIAKFDAMKRVAVIGAGAAGLCCARHLSRFPETFQFTVFEQSDQVGGLWVYHNPSPSQLPEDVRELSNYWKAIRTPYHSTMYKNLR